MDWIYEEANGLLEYTMPEKYAWLPGEDDTTYYERLGYKESHDEHIGNEYLVGGYKTLMNLDAPWRYLIVMNSPGSYAEHIWIPSFSSWLNFLARYGPAIAAHSTQVMLGDLTILLEKLFHAIHGHDYVDSCHACSPLEYTKYQRHTQHVTRLEGNA